jgi:hypothetical protein
VIGILWQVVVVIEETNKIVLGVGVPFLPRKTYDIMESPFSTAKNWATGTRAHMYGVDGSATIGAAVGSKSEGMGTG